MGPWWWWWAGRFTLSQAFVFLFLFLFSCRVTASASVCTGCKQLEVTTHLTHTWASFLISAADKWKTPLAAALTSATTHLYMIKFLCLRSRAGEKTSVCFYQLLKNVQILASNLKLFSAHCLESNLTFGDAWPVFDLDTTSKVSTARKFHTICYSCFLIGWGQDPTVDHKTSKWRS